MQRCITFSLQHHETVDKSLKIPAAWYKPPFCGARSADFAGCSRRGRRARVSVGLGAFMVRQTALQRVVFGRIYAWRSSFSIRGEWAGVIASRLAPTGGWWWTPVQGTPQIHCGSELARDSGGSTGPRAVVPVPAPQDGYLIEIDALSSSPKRVPPFFLPS